MWLLCFAFWAHEYTVAPINGDFNRIQDALDVAQAGDIVWVETGIYAEQIVFPRSGDAVAGSIQLRSRPGHVPVLDGGGFSGGNMVLMSDRSWILFRGFEIRNLGQINDGSGIRVLGAGREIELSHHHIHHLTGQDAMGITVYGTKNDPIAELRILNNWIHDCEPARSEALTLNGNIDGFLVADNVVTDVNNIGIDFIGGETDINPDPTLVARNGICRGNYVARARSNYGGGYAAGIYVDGGSNMIIEANQVTACDLGIEIGAENAGTTTEWVTVRSNWIHHNDKVGIVFGGFDAGVGCVKHCLFLNNTCYFNDLLGEGLGQLWIQYASDNRVENNIFVGLPGAAIHFSEAGNVNNDLDYNIWFAGSGGEWVWQGQSFASFSAFQAGAAVDGNGAFMDPLLVNPDSGDGHLTALSPAIDRGDPAALIMEVGSLDYDGQTRQTGRVDCGMDEFFTLPSCLSAFYADWGLPTDLCNGPRLEVLQYVALLNLSCSCPP